MANQLLQDLLTCQLVDLSLPLSSKIFEPDPPRISYVNHQQAAHELVGIANQLVQKSAKAPRAPITISAFKDQLGLANENMELDSHSGTHMDAPWHFGPLCEGKPAKTIDQIPLSWCRGPGVRLDVRHLQAGSEITANDLQLALSAINYTLTPGDIVLIMTGADQYYQDPAYFRSYPGMGREATEWLIDQGIRVMGIDSWGFDRPAESMLQSYVDSQDCSTLLPAHMLGREREYCHIEKMANLDKIPVSKNFFVFCFPIKLEAGSAGWVRAVALIPPEVL